MFKKNPKIDFICEVPYLKEIEDVRPVPSNKFIPEWWKHAPYDLNIEENKIRPESMLVRRCPSFSDFFSLGYILPMWADTTLFFNSQTGEWKWRCGSTTSQFKINFFEPVQFTDYASFNNANGKKVVGVFQLTSPWKIFMPKGYSVFQFPLFYHNNDFAALPGVFDANIASFDKIEIAIFEDQKEIFIKRGTPLVQYIPYKKTKIPMEIRDSNKKDKERLIFDSLKRETIFKDWYAKNRINP